ncbi:type I-E CRISPR-associated protein Cas6/Cse3/CasE [Streptomyces coacervatus]|uniref:Type I-E CRISPR-associated protein Cas6/Cse3/CasE n=1 Tax=Streptomyces coacervatus TaxID=647381 RepID=A0ABP7HK68_9ACTN|nr:type I-E CRISPR-associated protein Cas6/Cse3/CasE [Streptomyces coacervatus]MDF2272102.1 type I-E CRISPR-associated protein Cas6/Cse3/CasE [Streptomyces coacervatus]
MPTATLTRIRLNLAHPTVRRDLADYTALHRTVMRLLPDHLGPHPRQIAGALFRLERGNRQGLLLVQTRISPDLTALPHHYGQADTRDLTAMLGALTPGRRVRYRITANPSTRSRRPPGPGEQPLPKHGRVLALDDAAALAWWHRRATQAGLHLHTTTSEPKPFRRSGRDQPGPVHRLLQFDGTALITDPAALTDALLTGIGRAKSYGAGLLSLAPA